MNKIFFFILASTICITIIGCGFKKRSSNDIPYYLHTLHIESANPYDPLTIQLVRTLQALNVHFTKTRKGALILRISNISWMPPMPTIFYSSIATPYTYVLKVNFDLETVNGKILITKTLTLRRQLIQTPSQVYTPNATQLMKQEMTRTMVSLIYKYLVTLPHLSTYRTGGDLL